MNLFKSYWTHRLCAVGSLAILAMLLAPFFGQFFAALGHSAAQSTETLRYLGHVFGFCLLLFLMIGLLEVPMELAGLLRYYPKEPIERELARRRWRSALLIIFLILAAGVAVSMWGISREVSRSVAVAASCHVTRDT